MDTSYPELQFYIGGQWVDREDRQTYPVINPATEEVLGELPRATPADVAAAIEAARRGFEVWRKVSGLERGRLLRRTAELLRQKYDRLATLITLEMGKPIRDSRAEVDTAIGMFEWFAEEARRGYGRLIPPRAGGFREMVVWEPVGPVAGFSGWNAAAITPARKISGALAAGCSLVLKPSRETPASALVVAQAVVEAGVPAGVLNVIFGDSGRISQELLESPVIRKITFTGATSVGKRLSSLAVQSMKRMTMELGGHAPVVIFPDVDPAKVAASAVAAKFRSAGQICTSPTRFFIHQDIYLPFVDAFAAEARKLPIGNGLEEHVRMGPVANLPRLEAMERLVQDARERGVAIATGGRRIGERGYFFEPTLLVDFPDDCLAATQEPFGPLALARSFRTFDEAVALANHLPVGLASYAFTKDLATATAIGDAIDCGNVAINHWRVSLPETPFGGVKDSGLGLEGGIEGLQSFQKLKFISQASGS
ncbi:MAG: NAD-dependent succinate-semialdehyde dehydrogenase [Deltaproteobacteria bacterium]|nr:NAD-dependent succinate-semialdehyde dehydrogenase [Deltaproteobacteria bacterium]